MSGCIQVTELTWEVAVEKELNAMLTDGNVRNLNRFLSTGVGVKDNS